jgi:hypothetical protein
VKRSTNWAYQLLKDAADVHQRTGGHRT